MNWMSTVLRFLKGDRLIDLLHAVLLADQSEFDVFERWYRSENVYPDFRLYSRFDFSVPPETVSRMTAGQLLTEMARTAIVTGESLPNSVWFRAVAIQLDNTCRNVLIQQFISSVSGETLSCLKRNDLVLKPSYFRRAVYGQHLSTNPEKRRLKPRKNPLEQFCLAESEAFDRIDVFLDFSNRDAIDHVFDEGAYSLGIAELGLGIEDFSVKETWTDSNGKAFFWGVAPKDQRGAMLTIASVLRSGFDGGCNVVLFPELCLTDEMSEQARCLIESGVKIPSIVVCGSYHSNDTGYHELAGWIALPHGDGCDLRAIRHQKYHPLEDFRASSNDTLSFTECLDRNGKSHLTGRPSIRIHSSCKRSFACLICADAFPAEVAEVLSIVAVSLVTVCAMSKKHQPFDVLATQMVEEAQNACAIAMTPFRDGPIGLVQFPIYNLSQPWIQPSQAARIQASLAADEALQAPTIHKFVSNLGRASDV